MGEVVKPRPFARVVFFVGFDVVEDFHVRHPVKPSCDVPEPLGCRREGYWSVNQHRGSTIDEGCAEMSEVVWDIVVDLSICGVGLVDGWKGAWLGTGNREVVTYVWGVDQCPVTVSGG